MPNQKKNKRRWRLMPVLLLALTVTQSGCQIFQRFRTTAEPAPIMFNAVPTQAELLATLNAHASRVRQLQSSVSLSIDGMPKLKGTLQLERPDRLRLKAGVMGVSELGVDVGSNADMFWVWSKAALPGQPPAIYYAAREDFQNLQDRVALPIEPQWIIDASGLVEFLPTDVHQGPFLEAGRLKLHSIRQTANGPITRVTLLDPKSARVLQQSIYDANNRLVAYSNSSEYRFYEEDQVSLPQRIELHVLSPEGQDAKIVFDAGEYRINALYGDPDQMWSMPRPDGIPTINLAQSR